MYARLVSGSILPGKLEEAIQLWRDEVLPSVQQQRGFRSVRLLVDRQTGKIASLGLWETAGDFQATVAWNQGQVAKFVDLFATPPDVGGYEVIIEGLAVSPRSEYDGSQSQGESAMSDNKNDQVVVAMFPSAVEAGQAVEALKAWDKADDEIKLGAVGTLVIGEDGMLKTYVGHKTGKGAKTGAILGVIAGVFTGGLSLVAGLVGGAALGGGLGSFFKKSTNLTEAEVNKIILELKTGKAAVVITCDASEIEDTKAEMTMVGGTIWVYEVSPEELADAEEAAKVQAEIDKQTAEAGAASSSGMDQAMRWSQAV